MGRPSRSSTLSGSEGIIISHTNLIHRTLKKTSSIGELIAIEQANAMGFRSRECGEEGSAGVVKFRAQSYFSVGKDMEVDGQ